MHRRRPQHITASISPCTCCLFGSVFQLLTYVGDLVLEEGYAARSRAVLGIHRHRDCVQTLFSCCDSPTAEIGALYDVPSSLTTAIIHSVSGMVSALGAFHLVDYM